VKENGNSNEQRHSTEAESIGKYLNLSSSQKMPLMKSDGFESPFDENESVMSFARSTVSAGSRSTWSTLFLLTIVVCVLILPSSDSSDNAVITQQIGNTNITVNDTYFEIISVYAKLLIKYLTIFGYLLFVGSFIYGKYRKRKLKKF
jgi:hypothetical protein